MSCYIATMHQHQFIVRHTCRHDMCIQWLVDTRMGCGVGLGCFYSHHVILCNEWYINALKLRKPFDTWHELSLIRDGMMGRCCLCSYNLQLMNIINIREPHGCIISRDLYRREQSIGIIWHYYFLHICLIVQCNIAQLM